MQGAQDALPPFQTDFEIRESRLQRRHELPRRHRARRAVLLDFKLSRLVVEQDLGNVFLFHHMLFTRIVVRTGGKIQQCIGAGTIGIAAIKLENVPYLLFVFELQVVGMPEDLLVGHQRLGFVKHIVGKGDLQAGNVRRFRDVRLQRVIDALRHLPVVFSDPRRQRFAHCFEAGRGLHFPLVEHESETNC